MRFVILKKGRDEICLEWGMDRILQSLKKNLDKHTFQSKISLLLVKDPKNKILYKREFLKRKEINLKNVMQFVQDAFQDTLKDFMNDSIKIT